MFILIDAELLAVTHDPRSAAIALGTQEVLQSLALSARCLTLEWLPWAGDMGHGFMGNDMAGFTRFYMAAT